MNNRKWRSSSVALSETSCCSEVQTAWRGLYCTGLEVAFPDLYLFHSFGKWRVRAGSNPPYKFNCLAFWDESFRSLRYSNWKDFKLICFFGKVNAMSVVKWLLYTDKLNNSTLFFRNHAKILGFSFLAGKIINRFHANDNFTQRGGQGFRLGLLGRRWKFNHRKHYII